MRRQHGGQGQGGRHGLDEQDLFGRRHRTIDPSDHDAGQKEDLEGQPFGAHAQARDQPRGQEAVVQPLVGRQHLGLLGLLLRHAECPAALGLGPQKHLQHEDVEVQDRHRGDKETGQPLHV